MARMNLDVFLPIDRTLPGFLRLHNVRGHRLMYDIPCRGKADSAQAAGNDNPSRDPKFPYGDLPGGRYAATPVEYFTPAHRTFGATSIRLEGVTGDALAALENGRSGIAIHGNRGDDRLMATYGCLRVFDRDMALLVEAIGERLVEVEVFNCKTWPPLHCPTYLPPRGDHREKS